MRSMTSVIGCSPPRPAPRPGSETSRRSLARRASSRSWRMASARSASSASMRCLTWLSALPRSAFSAPTSLPSSLSSEVSAPVLPRKAALASARAASSLTAAKRLRASSISVFRSCFICFSVLGNLCKMPAAHRRPPERCRATMYRQHHRPLQVPHCHARIAFAMFGLHCHVRMCGEQHAMTPRQNGAARRTKWRGPANKMGTDTRTPERCGYRSPFVLRAPVLAAPIRAFHLCRPVPCRATARTANPMGDQPSGTSSADQAAAAPSVDFTCSTMALNAGLSLTASSASTLRSRPMLAFSRPFMKTL